MLKVGETVVGEIGAPSEEDRYAILLPDRQQLTLETSGETDIVMSVFGPDDETFAVR